MPHPMLPSYVLLDLETTGGNAAHDRITEIAAVRIEDGQEVARWSTLLNPGCSISPFIQSLTGISDQMVVNAPTFGEVAQQVLTLLHESVLVAHNVRFDHGFLQQAFAREQISLRMNTLCTVRLSRALYPQHRGHGLDAIMQRHGLHTHARHRAMGDVDVLAQWLRLAQAELGAEQVAAQALGLLQGSAALPPQLDTAVQEMPDTPGVYTLYGDGPSPLYIGKATKLRSRVLAHFQAASRQAGEMRLAQEVRRIEWTETAGELGALLLEARRLKAQHPIYNRPPGRERTPCAWRLDSNALARPLLTLVHAEDLQAQEFSQLYGLYRSKKQAISVVRELAGRHTLCLQALGLESGKGACAAYSSGLCKGVCCGREKPELHRLRLQLALAQQQLPTWPHSGMIGLREHATNSARTDIHLFDQWCYLSTVHDEAELEEALASRHAARAFDLDTYRLLLKYLAPTGKPGAEVVKFAHRG